MLERALSIKQPWAWLIVAGIKDVENRSWPVSFRGRLYIHASENFDNVSYSSILDRLTLGQAHEFLTVKRAGAFRRGMIIGEATLTDCKYRFPDENDDLYSPWHERGMYGFIFADPLIYDKPIPYKGQLRIFKVKQEVLQNEGKR